MKKIICIAASLSFFMNAEAQDKTKISLGDFNAMELSGASKVELFRSDSNYVVIYSKDTQPKLIDAKVKAGELYIWAGFNGEVHAKNLSSIRVTDASSVISSDTLTEDKIIMYAEDAGKINIAIHGKDIVVHSKDAGVIKLRGNTELLEVNSSDASNVNGFGLKATSVNVTSTDGSSALVWAVNCIKAEASDGSSIHVKGSPYEKNNSASDGAAITMDDSGEEAIPQNGRHSMGTFLEHDSVGDKKHVSHGFAEGFIGWGYVTGGSNDVDIKYGTSREFIIGVGGGYKFARWNSIGYDIYYKSTGYYINQNNSKKFPDTIQHNAQKVSLQNFGGLIYDRFTFTSGYHGQLSLDLGFYADWTFHTREVTWDDNSSVKTIYDGLSINPINHGLTARIVFARGLSCYFNYRLSNVFNFGNAPTLPACVLGITFGLGAN